MKYQVMPDLTPVEYEALKADIAANGVLVPVEVDEDGNTLDGHHRIRAWQELKDEGRQVAEYPRILRVGMTEEQKRNHARRLNIHRRHLSKEQRNKIIVAMREDGMSYRQIGEAVGVDAATAHRTVANATVEQPATITGRDGKERPATMPQRATPGHQPPHLPGLFVSSESQQQRYSEVIQTAKESAPDIYSQIANGQTKVTAARRELVHRQKAESPPLPTEGKYRVIYADPPWQYNNSGVIETAGGGEVYTRVEQHYPTMSIDEICAMDVRSIAETNSVLFLWTTSPMLQDAFKVIDAWGFNYKTSMVWNKVRHTYGHYVSVRHELLLIATRGSCTPDSKQLVNSVQTIERSNRNSQKPEQFRAIIDSMYTSGNRIELFSRTQADGWEAWGNERN